MSHRLVVFLSILAGLFVYTAIKARPFLGRPPLLAWAGTGVLFVLMIGWFFIYHAWPAAVHNRAFTILAWTGSTLMGAWAAYLLLIIPVDAVALATILIRKTIGLDPLSEKMRAIFFVRIPFGLLVASTLVAVIGFGQALMPPRIHEVSIPIKNLPPALQNLRMVLISDIHVGPTLPKHRVKQIVDRVMAQKPDLILFPGDLADGTPDTLSEQLRPLAELKAPMGVFFATGNHEYYWDAEKWIEKVKELGLTPLINENRVVKYDGVSVMVAGVTDLHAGQFIPTHTSDPNKAAQSDQPTQFKILLAHQPESATEAEKAGFHLQLSGHTHAGQYFPFNIPVMLFKSYYAGLNQRGSLMIYTSPGTGYWGPPNRFLVPPEITVVKLSSAS